MMSILNKIESLFNVLLTVISGSMLAIIFVQVLVRYASSHVVYMEGAFAEQLLTVSHAIMASAEELARYLFVYMVFLGLPMVAKKGGHMAIEALTERVGPKSRRILGILAELCTIGFLLLMAVQGIKMVVINHFQLTPGLEISVSIVFLAIPIGCGLMLLYSCMNLYSLIKNPVTDK